MNIKKKFYWARGGIKHRAPPLIRTAVEAMIYAVIFKIVLVYI